MNIDEDIKKKFVDLVCALSPERLSNDGELPKFEIVRRYRLLSRQWRELERKIKTKVTEEMAWSWHPKG